MPGDVFPKLQLHCLKLYCTKTDRVCLLHPSNIIASQQKKNLWSKFQTPPPAALSIKSILGGLAYSIWWCLTRPPSESFHHLLPINSNKTGVFSCETLSNMDAGALLGQPNEKKDPCASRPEQRRQRIWRSSWEIEDSQRISMLRERGWLPPLTDTFSWEKAATWILPYIKNFPPGEITNATSKGNKRQTAVL